MKMRGMHGALPWACLIALAGPALAAPPAPGGEPLVLGHRFSMQSAVTGEQRSYLVHLPTEYDLSTAHYPVLFVTDGNEHFEHVSATADLLAAAGVIPRMIVVGVPNVSRYRDLEGYQKESGPSKFLRFITDELAPRIDADYRTLPYRILTGWSDGGLFALHALMNAHGAFRGYIVLATAVGDDQAMPGTLRDYFAAHPAATLQADVYMGTDTSRGMGLSWAYETASILLERAARVHDLRLNYRYYADQSHMVIPLRGMDDGLRAIFDGWSLDDAFALYEQGGLPALEQHFTRLAERLGFPVAIPADALFAAFNGLEGAKRYPEAERVIARAVELYPQDTTALYYQARLQIEMGNKAAALETLKKSLQISPDDRGTRQMLRRLQFDPDTLVSASHPSEQELAGLVGNYGSPVVFAVTRRGDRLYGRNGNQEYELSPLSGLRFHYDPNNVYSNGGILVFRTDSSGRVTGVAFENGRVELARAR